MTSAEPRLDRCAAQCKSGGYCENHPLTDAERCRMHGGTNQGAPEGNQNALGNDGGPPIGSANGEKHGLRASREKLTARLDETELAFIDEITAGYIEQAPFDETHVFAHHVHELAIDAYKRHRANLYILDEGLTQEQVIGTTDEGQPIIREDENVVHQAYSRFVRDLRTELKDLGILGDEAATTSLTLRDVFISIQNADAESSGDSDSDSEQPVEVSGECTSTSTDTTGDD